MKKKSPFRSVLSLLIVVGVIASFAVWKNQRQEEVVVLVKAVEESTVPVPEKFETVAFTKGTVQTVSFTVRPKLGKNPVDSGEVQK